MKCARVIQVNLHEVAYRIRHKGTYYHFYSIFLQGLDVSISDQLPAMLHPC